MESGFLIYKCKRCGKLIKNTHAPNGMLLMAYLVNDLDVPNDWGLTPSKYEIHYCDDNNIGLCELIGFEFDKE